MAKTSKRGLSASSWLSAGLGIAFGVIIMAVLAIVLAAFGDSTTDGNASLVIDNGQTFLANMSEQLPTVGTIAGVLLLLGLVIASGIGGYALYQKSKGNN